MKKIILLILDGYGINKSDYGNAIKEAKAIEASGYGTYTRNVDDSIYDVKNISEFFFREDGTLYIVYAYGNNNYTSELDIIQI